MACVLYNTASLLLVLLKLLLTPDQFDLTWILEVKQLEWSLIKLRLTVVAAFKSQYSQISLTPLDIDCSCRWRCIFWITRILTTISNSFIDRLDFLVKIDCFCSLKSHYLELSSIMYRLFMSVIVYFLNYLKITIDNFPRPLPPWGLKNY